MTTPDPNQSPYDPWSKPGTESQPGPQSPPGWQPQPGPQSQPGWQPYPGSPPLPGVQPGGNPEPTAAPGSPSPLPTWPQQPDGSAYPQYGYYQPPYTGAQYPGAQYPGAQYPGAQYPGGPYGGQPFYPPDPLVPHPGGGFNAWWGHVWSAFARSWRQLVPIVALTTSLPTIVYSIIAAQLDNNLVTVIDNGATQDVIPHWGPIGAFVGLLAAFVIVTVFAGAVGWFAGMWTIVRQAAGVPAPLGMALALGVRRCARIGGILVVVGLMVTAGLALCVIPGLYLAVAASLAVPFAMFDRGTSAIGGSFRVVNRNFGAVLGRLVIMYAILIGASTVANVIVAVTASNAGAAGSAVLISVVLVPATMFLMSGILMTYAQMRARTVPTTVHDLVAAAGA